MSNDDFPLSPDCWADAAAFYQAFLKAEDFLSSVPAKSRGVNVDRSLYDLTRHLYAQKSEPEALFRAKLGASETLAAVWLSKVRTLAEWFSAAQPVAAFQGLFVDDLRDLVKLSADPSRITQVASCLVERGVILIYEPHIPGMKVDGAVFKLASGTPVIGMSLRYPRLDYFWFTLMHELSHVVLHGDLLSTPIIDDMDTENTDLVELQADKLATDSLIPRGEWRSCPAKYSLAERDVLDFAAKLGIAPQIVAGRLRREFRRHDLFSELVNRINIRETLFGSV